MERWVDNEGLVIMNDGKTETCVRAQGSSMVDVTIGTEKAARDIRDWKVDTYVETLSDHKYITFRTVGSGSGKEMSRGKSFPRWNSKKCDWDWFAASILCGDWTNKQRISEFINEGEIEKAERMMKRIVKDACDSAMKRAKTGKNKVYWWNTEIAELRGICNM